MKDVFTNIDKKFADMIGNKKNLIQKILNYLIDTEN